MYIYKVERVCWPVVLSWFSWGLRDRGCRSFIQYSNLTIYLYQLHNTQITAPCAAVHCHGATRHTLRTPRPNSASTRVTYARHKAARTQ